MTKPGGWCGYIECSMLYSNLESPEKNVLSCFGNFDVILEVNGVGDGRGDGGGDCGGGDREDGGGRDEGGDWGGFGG